MAHLSQEEISDVLSQWGLGMRLDVTPATPNYRWLSMAEEEAKRLCAWHNEPVSFTFIATEEINAGAVPCPALIVMAAGCFDFLCRLANTIVGKGIYTDIDPRTASAVEDSDEQVEKTIRSILKKQQWFAPDMVSWSRYSEKEGIFCFILLSLFRFVILHEMGHIVHRHGRRSHLSGQGYLLMDGIEQPTMASDSILDSHAREIVADKTAMQLCHHLLEEQFFILATYSDIKEFAHTYLGTEINRIKFLTQIAYLYFAAIDQFLVTPFEIGSVRSHPPAPFRAITIATTAVHGYEKDPRRTQVVQFLPPAENMLAIAIGKRTNRQWLAQLLEDPRYEAHYRALFDRVDRWSIVSQTVPRQR
ncbi:MAG: hypothetical protein GAK35_01069 [Herbaspirillum frisingense]|uniref:Uncharacterized protein n=1 Tax=Herbaspirillum frisingense TaxID=92645 RepID=A0A7V8FYT4_9BURK|nr:MAG: hypothetical protein GAK35_01069 [Herbaspirillum frisingense]